MSKVSAGLGAALNVKLFSELIIDSYNRLKIFLKSQKIRTSIPKAKFLKLLYLSIIFICIYYFLYKASIMLTNSKAKSL